MEEEEKEEKPSRSLLMILMFVMMRRRQKVRVIRDDDGNELQEEIKILKEKKEKLSEENEYMRQKIARLERKKRKLSAILKPHKRGDDVFLTLHPWENPNDVFLRLQNERNSYIARCKIYSIGVGHLRLRIFAFVICLWITHILTFLLLFLILFICGRYISNKYIISAIDTLSISSIKNRDFLAYIIGVISCIIIPNEIHFIYHSLRTLINNIKKFLIRMFIFVFVPLYVGYGWNIMIYQFIHSISVTPIYCILEIYCTGIYITIIYLLFQIIMIYKIYYYGYKNNRNNNNVNLYRFWKQIAWPF